MSDQHITSSTKMEKFCDDSGFLDGSWLTMEETPGENPTDSGHESSSHIRQDSGTTKSENERSAQGVPQLVPQPGLELENRIDAGQPLVCQNTGCMVETHSKSPKGLDEDDHKGIQANQQNNTLLQQNNSFDNGKDSFSSRSIDLVMDKVDRFETSERLISGIDGILLVQKSQTAYMENLIHQISEKMDRDRLDRVEESSRLMAYIQALMADQTAIRSVVENQGRTFMRMETDYSGLYEMNKLMNSRIDGMIREQRSLASLIENCSTKVSSLDAKVQILRRNLATPESTSKGSSAKGSKSELDKFIGLSSKTANPIDFLKQLGRSKSSQTDPEIKLSMTRFTQTDPSFQYPFKFSSQAPTVALSLPGGNRRLQQCILPKTLNCPNHQSTKLDSGRSIPADTTQKCVINLSTESRNTPAISKYESNKPGSDAASVDLSDPITTQPADPLSDDNADAKAEMDHSTEPKTSSVESPKDPETQTIAISAQKSQSTPNAGESDKSKSGDEDIRDEGLSPSAEQKPTASDLPPGNVKAVCYSYNRSSVPESFTPTAGVVSDLTFDPTTKAIPSAVAVNHGKSQNAKDASSGTGLDTTATESRHLNSADSSTKQETNTTTDYPAAVVPNSTPITSENAQKPSSTDGPIENALPSITSPSANGSDSKGDNNVEKSIPSTDLITFESDLNPSQEPQQNHSTDMNPTPVAIQYQNVGVVQPYVIIPGSSASASNTPTVNPLPSGQQNPAAARTTYVRTDTTETYTPAVTAPARSPSAVTTPARSAVTAPAMSSSAGIAPARSTSSLTSVTYHPVTYDYGVPCYTGSRASASSSYSCEPNTKKHVQFVSESLRNKAVDSIPGIGKVLGGRLANQGFEKASSISAAYRRMGGDQEKFENWIKNKSGANTRQARAAYKGLRDYYD